jgi:cyanophycinase-like exopeptidase
MKLSVRLATPVHSLLLIGGGEFSFGETRELDQMLLSRMPSDRRTVAFLPTASGSAEYATHFGNYLRSLDPTVDVVNVPIYRGRDSRRQKSLNTILAAGAVYLGGGVASTLLGTVRASAAEIALREAAASGAVIAAIGASAAAFGIAALDARGNSSVEGFGWLEGAAIETGFDPQNDVGLRRLMSLPDVELGLGLPTRTGLWIAADGSTEIVGEGQIAAFRKR